MANPEKVERAFFKVEGVKDKVEVHFNPESLQYTISNTLKNTGKGNSKKQYISESTGKLNLDLIFDSTASGEDVRLKTIQIAKFMEPMGKGKKATPPVVNFEWGMYKFKGMVETYQETIDFFSANGVPLRASTSISMSSQDAVFEGGSKGNGGTTGSPDIPNTAIPASADTGKGKGTTDIATKAGNPAAAKDIAAKNGVENMRFPGSTPLEIDESFSFKDPAAFASGSIGLNASAGAGLNLGAAASGGLNLDASAGAGSNLGASASLSVGASASAGVSASAGAFNGLHAISNTSASTNLSLDKFIDTDLSAKLGLDASSIGFGGGAALQGSASFKAEVGKAGELKAKLEFDGG